MAGNSSTALNPGTGGDSIYDEDIGGGIKMPATKLHGGGLGRDTGPVWVNLAQKLVMAGIVRVGGDSFNSGLGVGEDAGWFPTSATTASGGTGSVSNRTLALATTNGASSSSLLSSIPVVAQRTGDTHRFAASVQVPASPTAVQITTYKGGTPSTTAAATFSQGAFAGATDGAYHGWSVEYAGNTAVFYYDGAPVHFINLNTAISATLYNTSDLPQSFEVVNSSGTTTMRWGMFTLSGTAPQDGFAIEVTYSTTNPNTMNVQSPSVTRYGSTMAVDPQTSGSITATNQSVTMSCGGLATVDVQVTGTWSGTLEFDATLDGTNWFPIRTYQYAGAVGSGSQAAATTTTGNGLFVIPCAGAKQVRCTSSTFTWNSGTASIALRGSTRPSFMPMASRVQPIYGPQGQSITITLASLASSQTAGRQSTAVNNTLAGTFYDDVDITIKLKTGSGAVSSTGFVAVYGYASVDGGTTYPEGVTGTDGAATILAPSNLPLLFQANVSSSSSTTFTFGAFSFCQAAQLTRLPAWWGIVVVNVTGTAFDTTGGNFAVTYQGINPGMA